MQFVQCRATAKREGLVQDRMRVDIDECSADDEVLLDLRIVNPRCFRPPFGDVVTRDHMSGSTSALTSTFHAEDRCACRDGLPGTSGV